MDEKVVEVLCAKLDAIIKLMVFAITEAKSQTERIRLLSKAGFEPKQIAQTLGTTPNTVRVTLSNLKKQKSEGPHKRGGRK